MRILLILVICLVSYASHAQTEIINLSDILHAMNAGSGQPGEPEKLKKQITEVKSEWFLLIYNIQKYGLLCDFLYSVDDLERIAELQYNAGEISFLDKQDLIIRLAEAETKANIAGNEIVINKNRIQQLMQNFSDFVPADSSLTLYMIDKNSVFLPSLSDSLPNAILEKQIENRQLELDNLFIKLQLLGKYKIPYADDLIHSSYARYKSEEIDYIELVNNLSIAFSIKSDYLETVNNYNQSAIQLEFYAY